MNVYMMHDSNDETVNLKVELFKDAVLKEEKMKIIEKITAKKNIDVYLLFYNDISKIEDVSKNIPNDKIVILTSNLDTEFIVSALNITSNICYLNNKSEENLTRILRVYANKK